jgi:hypothetical protein
MKKLITAAVLLLSATQAQAAEVAFNPLKANVGYQTAGCMFEWMQGSLHNGVRDREALIVSAVNMCGGIATQFGWTVDELKRLAEIELRYVPGVGFKPAPEYSAAQVRAMKSGADGLLTK